MAVKILHKRSAVEFKNATGAQLELGELGLNYHESGPYLQCKDADGQVVQLGGVFISSDTGDAPGNPLPGKWWLRGDTLFLYDGNAWVEIGGTDDDGGGESITVIGGDGIEATKSGATVTVSVDLATNSNGLDIVGGKLTALVATANTLGTVKIGDGLSVGSDGEISVDVTSDSLDVRYLRIDSGTFDQTVESTGDVTFSGLTTHADGVNVTGEDIYHVKTNATSQTTTVGYVAQSTNSVTCNTAIGFQCDSSFSRNTPTTAAVYGFYSEIFQTQSPNGFNFYAAGNAPNFFKGDTYIGGSTSRNTFDLWKSTLTEEQLEQYEAGTYAVPANVSVPGDGSFARQWWYNQQSAEDQVLLDNGELEYPTHLAAATFTNTFDLGDNTKINLNSDGSSRFALDAVIHGITVGRGAGAFDSNTAVGNGALQANTTGENNAAIGYLALYSNTTGEYNTANGSKALFSNTTGNLNSAIGIQALYSNTTGESNTAIGINALYSNTTGSDNTAIGRSAMEANVKTDAVDIVAGTTYQIDTVGTTDFTAIGAPDNNVRTTFLATGAGTGTGIARTKNTGELNTAVGRTALLFNTTGNLNSAMGGQALRFNTTGTDNTANGVSALSGNTTGNSNTAIGRGAMEVSISTNAVDIVAGTTYQIYTVGTTDFTAIGAPDNNVGTTFLATGAGTGTGIAETRNTGSENTAVGRTALRSNTTGDNNTAVGRGALFSNTTGSGNFGAAFFDAAGNYAPVFDPTIEDNRIVMGHTSVTNAYVQVAWTVVSDQRDKMNFGTVPHGLDFIKQLNPVSYQFKIDRDTEKANGPIRYGFKAQDILALEGEDNAVIIDNEDPDKLRYNGEALVPVLVNAIKEQQAIIEALTARLDAAGI